MNIITTHNCNKGCPFCFARLTRDKTPQKKREMSYETFHKILNKLPPGHKVKLVGGESTTHSQFEKFVELAIKQQRPINIISNFLFSDEICDYILDVIERTNITFLVNANYLEENNRIEQWQKNYNKIYKKLYSLSKEEDIGISITVDHNYDWECYLNYLDYLIEKTLRIERVRYSIIFPGDKESKENFYFINNKKLGETFLILVKKAINMNWNYSIDCILYMCMFNNREELKFIKRYSTNFLLKCGDKGLPSDVFPDESASYCYPLKEIIRSDTRKYDDIAKITNDLTTKYRLLKSRVKMPEACIKCGFYKSGACHGPCLGFFDLSNETLFNDYI